MQTETAHSFRAYRSSANHWTSIRLLNVYRLGLSAFFFSQSFISESPLLIITNLVFYSWISLIFLILALVSMLAAWIERRGFQQQLSVQIYTDTILIVLLMHACGGISSGIGTLLIISIAATSLLAEQSAALIFASLASLILLAEHIYSAIYLTSYGGTSTQVGILGATLFATAFITHKLVSRLRSSEQLVQQREHDLALLSALNQEIIENLQAGVIVLGNGYSVHHINQAALQMLKIVTTGSSLSLKNQAPELVAAFDTWQKQPRDASFSQLSETVIEDVQVSFRALPGAQVENTLIFLSDISAIKHRMQQDKLASLGQLTASIAHEIRNPLGAISHAAQLLLETRELAGNEHRMTEIIHQHVLRINRIIEDILHISRGTPAALETFDGGAWLKKFNSDFCLSHRLSEDQLQLETGTEAIFISFDTGHLHQVMTNLCANALQHAQSPIQITIAQHPNQRPCIEVADQGPAIDTELLDQIFEPFFTTSHRGSGLGLYIVSQLCERNHATILARQNSARGNSFIIQPALPVQNSIPTS